jgi:ribonucleoside-diphosphate reductase beta chain
MGNRYFNPQGDNPLDEHIFNANPTGFIDFNRSRYAWASNNYDLMIANTWFPSEVNCNGEAKAVKNLTEAERRMYKLIFAQLSFDDSVQSFQLIDYASRIQNSIVKATVIKQSEQEINHSKSYAVLLDMAGNSEEVFDLYKTEQKLAEKNNEIAENYLRFQSQKDNEGLLLWGLHNQMLEGIYFLSGFAGVYLIGDKVQGAKDMISFIQRDEVNTHLPFYANLIKVLLNENNFDKSVIDKVYAIVTRAVELEIDWFKYITNNNILGVTSQIITQAIEYWGNQRLKAIGLEQIFEQKTPNHIVKLVEANGAHNEVRTNFFEGNVKNYSKGSISFDDF